jgi:hypothetical protein
LIILIIGEDGKAFFWKGNSGKIIVIDDDAHRPVVLLWGSWQERLRHVFTQAPCIMLQFTVVWKH